MYTGTNHIYSSRSGSISYLQPQVGERLIFKGELDTDFSLPLADGKILIGGADGASHEQTMSGDATINSLGVITLSSGVITPGTYNYPTQIVASSKGQITGISSSLNSGQIIIGDASNVATQRTLSGDATLGNTGALTLATVTTYKNIVPTGIEVDAKGRVLYMTNTLPMGSFIYGNTLNRATVGAMSGDGTLNGPQLILNSVISPGSFNYSTSITIDAQGRTTAVSSTLSPGQIVIGSSGSVATPMTLSGDATVSSLGAVTLASIGTAGSYTLPNLVIDAQGRVTSAVSNNVVPSINGGTGVASNYSISVGGNLTTTDVLSVGASTPTAGNILIGSGTNFVTRAISGDVTLSTLGVSTLATVNATTGSFTNASITVNNKGLITAASSGSSAIALTNSQIFVGNASNIATAVPMSGDATIANTGALTLATVPLAKGGTGSSLTAALGGIAYSTASGISLTAGMTTNGKVLMSSGTGVPVWSTCAYPSIMAANTMPYAVAANVLTSTSNLLYDDNSSTGGLTISNATASTSKTTGSIKITGGIGVTGSIFTNVLNASSNTGGIDACVAIGNNNNGIWNPNNTSIGILSGGIDTARFYVNDNILYVPTRIVDTTDATSTITGSLKTAGGLGVAKSLYTNSIITSNNAYARIVSTGAQSIPNNTQTSLNNNYWGTVSISGDSSNPLTYVASTGVWTVGITGIYTISFNMIFSGNNTGIRAIIIPSGSSNLAYINLTSTQNDRCGISSSVTHQLASGATFVIQVYQSSGGNLAMDTGVRGLATVYRIG